MGEYLVFIGILIIVVGFALKLDVLGIVLLAGLVTGLAGGLGLTGTLKIMGEGFVNNRLMSLFLISFPVIAIMERYGLKEKARDFISQFKMASAGSVLWIYLFIRWIAAAVSLRLGGHVQFIRPLILPMAEGAARKKVDLTEVRLDELKGLAAAVENYGNFYGQNIFPLASGVLLMQTTLKDAVFPLETAEIAKWSIFAGVSMLIIALIQCAVFEMKLRKDIKNVWFFCR